MPKSKSKKTKSKKKDRITPRVSKFIDFYIELDNQTQAAIRAGYSPNGAPKQANRLLKNDIILKELGRRRKEYTEKAGVKAQDVINEIAKIAFANSDDFFNWGWQEVELAEGVKIRKGVALLRPPEELTRDHKACIQSIKETKDGIELKLYDKQRALDSLKQYLGLNNEADIAKALAIKKGEIATEKECGVEDKIKQRMEKLKDANKRSA